MKTSSYGLGVAFLLLLAFETSAQNPAPLLRVPNTTLRMPQTPPVFGFTTERAFGTLRFTDPVAIVTPPGETDRLFIVEQRGRIAVVTNLVAPTRTVFLDLSSRTVGGVPPNEQGLLGLAFHPGYKTNRFFYVFYTATGAGSPNRLSRFETSPDNPNSALPGSELILINQTDDASNHNGGDIHFGPDGYLYVALGDEGGGDDQFANSQRIDRDFFAGILRIDVDKRPGSLPPNSHAAATAHYTIPPDNPFIGAAEFAGRPVIPSRVRTEFYAVGLRNPWRMAFDPATGHLYTGDVGQGAREEIDLIVKGGNYGWNFREGKINGPRRTTAAVTHINPIHDYGRSDGISVTGGVVYRGNRFSQLYGHYIFADYGSGNLWALLHQEGKPPKVQRLTGDAGIAGFGIDPRNGDVLIADVAEDTIKRLVHRPNPTGSPLPAQLSDTGVFADLATLTPNAGIVDYDLNLPFWSDNARKRRWFSVPDAAQTIGFNRDDNWEFPAGSVWVKHFDLELTNGVASSARRLETRLLVRNTEGIYGATYRWDAAQQNATLVEEEGLDEPFVINDGGIIRTQVWHYPSRSECLACHTPAAGHVLGFKTAQLNREFNYNGTTANQIQALSSAGYFSQPVSHPQLLPALAEPTDQTASLEHRVRSYLAVNCSQCHQPGGSALGSWDARHAAPHPGAGLINGQLISDGGDPATRLIVPGSLDQSMVLRRIATQGQGRMPPIASSVLDKTGIELLSAWITNSLAGHQTFTQWQLTHFGSTDAPNAAPDADPDKDGARNSQEYLTGHNPLSATDRWAAVIERTGDKVRIGFPRLANRAFEVQATTNLNDSNSWAPLNSPANRPFFPASTSNAVVEDVVTGPPEKYYRVRVFAP